MTRHFYGIHLQSSKLSAAFDVIRYLSEPDGIRFSHITLRGPYSQPLSSHTLREMNQHHAGRWAVRLNGAGAFIGDNQNTVIIKIDLLELSDLFYKPDFDDGIPHLTLYDGTDLAYANSLLRILYRFDFHEQVDVSQLQKIGSKLPSGPFAITHNEFYQTFVKFFGEEPSTNFVKSLSPEQKLLNVARILEGNFKTIFNNLNKSLPQLTQMHLPLDGDKD